jgi:hypothetical protein
MADGVRRTQTMGHTYCVWYRVTQDALDTELAVRAMMARLACRTGVAGQLLRKRDEPGLWMEVYTGVTDPDAFERRLAQAADEYDLGMFIAGERRVECFIPQAACAPACNP